MTRPDPNGFRHSTLDTRPSPPASHVSPQPSAQGHARLSTKDDTLQRICGGYHSPSKAFHDLRQNPDYRTLFDTSRRGFISLRHLS